MRDSTRFAQALRNCAFQARWLAAAQGVCVCVDSSAVALEALRAGDSGQVSRPTYTKEPRTSQRPLNTRGLRRAPRRTFLVDSCGTSVCRVETAADNYDPSPFQNKRARTSMSLANLRTKTKKLEEGGQARGQHVGFRGSGL